MDHLHDMQAKEIAKLREERDEARKKNADLNRRNQALESEVVKMKKRDRREERRAAEVARHMGAFDRVVMFAAQDKVRELERDLEVVVQERDDLDSDCHRIGSLFGRDMGTPEVRIGEMAFAEAEAALANLDAALVLIGKLIRVKVHVQGGPRVEYLMPQTDSCVWWMNEAVKLRTRTARDGGEEGWTGRKRRRASTSLQQERAEDLQRRLTTAKEHLEAIEQAMIEDDYQAESRALKGITAFLEGERPAAQSEGGERG